MPPGELAHTLVHVERVRRLHNPPLPLSRTCGRDERRKRRAGARRSWSASAGAAPSATSPAVRGPRPPPRPALRPPRLRLGPAAHSPCPELESAPRWAGARRSGRPSQAGQARRPRRKAAARCFRSGPQRTGARAARGRWAPPGNNALQTSPHRERKQARNSLTDAPTRRVTVCPRGTPVRNGTGASRNASHCSDASGRMGIQWQCHWKYGLSSDGIAITTSAIP